MDTVVDFISVFIVEPVVDFFRGKFSFSSWAINSVAGFLLTIVILICVMATAWNWYQGEETVAVIYAVLTAVLLIADGWRYGYWRKKSKKDE